MAAQGRPRQFREHEEVVEGEVISPAGAISNFNPNRSFSLIDPEPVDKRREGILRRVKKQDQETEDARIGIYDATIERVQSQQSLLFAAEKGVVDTTKTIAHIEQFGMQVPLNTGTREAFEMLAARSAAALIVANDDYNQAQHATNLGIISRRRLR